MPGAYIRRHRRGRRGGGRQSCPRSVAEKATDGIGPVEAEPMKVLAVDLGRERGRDGVARRPAAHAVSKLDLPVAGLRALEGHSNYVRCGVRCTL